MYTEIHRGSFTSTGTSKVLTFTTDVDWMNIYNHTVATNQTNNAGVEFYWQRGMVANDGQVKLFNAGSTAINMATCAGLAVPGFTLFDSSTPTQSAAVAVTDISAAMPARVTCANTTGLVTGDIVRLSFTSPQVNQFGGLDFTITTDDATHFFLAYAPQIVAGAGMAAYWRKLNYTDVWYPGNRVISKIAPYIPDTTKTVITMTVTHQFQVGEKIRLKVPRVTASTAFGMNQLDGIETTVTAIGVADADGITNTILIDIDTNAYAAFNWPLTAFDRFVLPQVMPIGVNSAMFTETRTFDAMQNNSARGIILGAGITSPAGQVGNIIYYTVGKSNL